MKMDAELRRGGWGPTTSRLGWARTNDHQAPERWIAAGTAAEPYVPGAIHVSGRPKQPTHEHPGSAPEWLDVDATPRRAGAIHVRGQRSQMTVDTSDASRLPGSPVTNLVVYLPKWSVKSGQGQHRTCHQRGVPRQARRAWSQNTKAAKLPVGPDRMPVAAGQRPGLRGDVKPTRQSPLGRTSGHHPCVLIGRDVV